MYHCYDGFMAKIMIREILKKKNIKVARVLPFLSISRSTFYNILNGSKSPTLDELEEIASVLGVRIEELYESKCK